MNSSSSICQLCSAGLMGNIFSCCMILDNMILEDEYKAEDCDNNYLFEDSDTPIVNQVDQTDLTYSILLSNHLSTAWLQYMSD